jgi:SRSO17 transposase
MGLADDGGPRFEAYVEGLVSVIGHKDREGPLRDYCTGLMMPCERKSVEPMAAVTAPARVAAQHQSLLYFVGAGGWSDRAGIGQGARDGLAGDRAARRDLRMDHR